MKKINKKILEIWLFYKNKIDFVITYWKYMLNHY
jgi:hypothetical protein